MDYGDLLLTPIYIAILFFLFAILCRKYPVPLLKNYYLWALGIKMFACVLFSIYYVYLSPGDSLHLYYEEGHALYRAILRDPANTKYLFKTGLNYDFTLINVFDNRGYFYSEANVAIIKLTTICCFFTFGKFLPINLLFAALGFAGLWRLFLFFYEQKPRLHRAFAVCILFFPSVVFWSSGLLKDTICMAAIGFITYSSYNLFYARQKIFKNLILFLLFSTLLAVVKVYILLAFLPFLVLFIILKKIGRIKIAFLRFMLAPALVIFCIGVFAGLFMKYQDSLGQYALEEITTSISNLNAVFAQKSGDEDAASNFQLGVSFEPSVAGLIRIAPYAVVATFFRPFIWEAAKVSQLIAALESILLILFTIYVLLRSRFYWFLYYILTDPLILFCFFFAVTFGVFIGASTLNFGTLVRYKIPCLPFYTIALVLVLDRVTKRKLTIGKESRQSLNL